MDKNRMKPYREFLKDTLRKTINFTTTDQNRGVKPPPLSKPYPEGSSIIYLPREEKWEQFRNLSVAEAIANRKSRRYYSSQSLTLDELSFLLWATQGIKRMAAPGTAYRTVPSAGCRHAFETYLAVFRVENLETGVYRYLPVEHALLFEFSDEQLSEKLIDATIGQEFTGMSAVTFIWSVIPYRMEWRYDIAAHRVIAMDAGHLAQNLYLACEAIGTGTCAVAAYDQQQMDELLYLDGEDEFVIYLAPVGKLNVKK